MVVYGIYIMPYYIVVYGVYISIYIYIYIIAFGAWEGLCVSASGRHWQSKLQGGVDATSL